MLRVLAVDDEVHALSELALLLRQDSRVEQVLTASDGVTALQDMVAMIGAGDRLDGVFLDIRMPGLDGLNLARLVAAFPNPPKLVFVTAHDDRAVQAFELEAVDYLLKPLRPERVAEAVRRLEQATYGPAAPEPAMDDVIPVELSGRTSFVHQHTVAYAEASGDYVRLHTADGTHLVRMSLAALERRWASSGFIRIHRSTLVSARHVTEMRFDEGRIVLRVGETTLPVSRRHSRRVRDQLVRQFRVPPSPAFGLPACPAPPAPGAEASEAGGQAARAPGTEPASGEGPGHRGAPPAQRPEG
ncbi:DNA-binding response regulator [Sphaerisporangium melleum]|uniref:DNA-binding response regulator n=1 Tax=Sphaerisporangium melleum TaxID=321316 RepID=A0A917RJH1_9ACTN|nr:LytTR family DNA-binding domain-containing protein [Sphaerisporangium melleum]GGL09499.1 DNA-binding response regulator [Sphaerisporangium melleum]GII67568.1 DNA-binding response regulator [Sphaerisporangium melleum]